MLLRSCTFSLSIAEKPHWIRIGATSMQGWKGSVMIASVKSQSCRQPPGSLMPEKVRWQVEVASENQRANLRAYLIAVAFLDLANELEPFAQDGRFQSDASCYNTRLHMDVVF